MSTRARTLQHEREVARQPVRTVSRTACTQARAARVLEHTPTLEHSSKSTEAPGHEHEVARQSVRDISRTAYMRNLSDIFFNHARPCYCEHRTRHPVPHRSSSRQQARGIDRQRSFCIWAVLSTQAPISCQRSNGGSDSHGHATVDSSGSYTIWRLPRSL